MYTICCMDMLDGSAPEAHVVVVQGDGLPRRHGKHRLVKIDTHFAVARIVGHARRGRLAVANLRRTGHRKRRRIGRPVKGVGREPEALQHRMGSGEQRGTYLPGTTVMVFALASFRATK